MWVGYLDDLKWLLSPYAGVPQATIFLLSGPEDDDDAAAVDEASLLPSEVKGAASPKSIKTAVDVDDDDDEEEEEEDEEDEDDTEEEEEDRSIRFSGFTSK
jgi:hypothetical protein